MTTPTPLPKFTILAPDGTIALIVPMATDDREHLAKIAGEIAVSLKPGYRLEWQPEGAVSE